MATLTSNAVAYVHCKTRVFLQQWIILTVILIYIIKFVHIMGSHIIRAWKAHDL